MYSIRNVECRAVHGVACRATARMVHLLRQSLTLLAMIEVHAAWKAIRAAAQALPNLGQM